MTTKKALESLKDTIAKKYEIVTYKKDAVSTDEQFQYFQGAEEALDEVIEEINKLLEK